MVAPKLSSLPNIGKNKSVETLMKPSSSKLYKEENGKIILTTEEKVFNGSYGLDPILIKLEQLLTDPKNKINTVAINVATCIRNALDKSISDDDNIQKISIEVEYFLEMLSSFFERSNVKHPYVVLYLNDYITQMSPEIIRPATEGKLLYFELIHEFWMRMKSLPIKKLGILTVKMAVLEPPDYDTKLYKLLQEISKITPSASYTGYYCLISHQPLDFHLLNTAPNGMIISSHTGEVITNKMLSSKVFGEPDVPFNKITHRVLGDKYQIKPLVKIGVRRNVIEKAKNNKWRIRTLEQIGSDLKTLGIPISERMLYGR